MDEFTLVATWLAKIREVIDLDGLEEPDLKLLLSTVRSTSHSVIHPAGPVASFAAGYATAKAGGSAEAASKILATLQTLVDEKAAAVLAEAGVTPEADRREGHGHHHDQPQQG